MSVAAALLNRKLTQLIVVTFLLLAQLLSSRSQTGGGATGAAEDIPTAPITLTSVTLTPSEQVVGVGGSAFFRQ